MTRFVEISPEAVAGVRSDVAATRAAVEVGLGPLRWRASALGVPVSGFDEVLGVADRLGTSVLPVVDRHLARARDLADLRYGGALGPVIPVVDEDLDPFAPVPVGFAQTPLVGGGTALAWPAAPVVEQEADEAATGESRGIGGWFSDRWDDVAGAVEDGTEWVGSTAADAWEGMTDLGGEIGAWWESTTADLGSWVDENLAGVREWVGEHVGLFRFLASACRVIGWVLVAVGAVLTVVLAVVGGLVGFGAGTLLGGVGGVPAGAAGVLAGATVGLKVLGAGFALVSVGDFLDVVADWGEGKIDGQDLVQRGSLELGLAITSLIGVGVVGKILQKGYKHLPDSWQKKLEDLLDRGDGTDAPGPTAPEPPVRRPFVPHDPVPDGGPQRQPPPPVPGRFTSSDAFVGDAANALDAAFPGRVRDINVEIPMHNGLLREVDVDLGDVVVQVKKGNARGLTGQLAKTEQTTGRTAVGYAPEMKDAAWEAAARDGVRIARTPEELVAMIREIG